MPQRRKVSRQRICQLERLESRYNLAGVVTITYDPATGDLMATGDAAGNEFTVTDNGGGWTLTGLNGTQFLMEDDMGGGMGMPMPVDSLMIGSVGTATLMLEDGADLVTLDGVQIGADLIFEGGLGNDELLLTNAVFIGGNGNINMGDGSNKLTIELDVFIQEQLNITGGSGTDDILISDLTVTELMTISPNGNTNNTTIVNVIVGETFTYNGGSLVDNVNITDLSVLTAVTINLGNGINELNIGGLETLESEPGAGLDVFGGTGADTINIDSAELSLDLLINAGNGLNSVTVTNTTTLGPANITTGNGADLIFIQDCEFFRDEVVNDVDGNLNISTGNGANDITAYGVEVWGDINIIGGTGLEKVLIFSAVTDDGDGDADDHLIINVGNGGSDMRITNALINGNIQITAANGIDQIQMGLYFSVAEPPPLTGDLDGDGDVDGGMVVVAGFMTIDTGNGADALDIALVNVFEEVYIVTGGSADNIQIYNVVWSGDSITIDTSTTIVDDVALDNDLLNIGYLYSPITLLNINTGDFSDLVSFYASAIGRTRINTGALHDTVAMFIHNIFDDLFIETGTGSDTVRMDNCLSNLNFGILYYIDANNGYDTVQVNGSIMGELRILTSTENDRVTITGNIMKDFFAELGEGELDELYMELNQIGGSGLANGGSGRTDRLVQVNNAFGVRNTIVGWELL
ncbi:MAG: hypothetical protein SFX18_11595 [Pirellulales bacterium]|nr:hypothetical protein [Pirellulales bacterium]